MTHRKVCQQPRVAHRLPPAPPWARAGTGRRLLRRTSPRAQSAKLVAFVWVLLRETLIRRRYVRIDANRSRVNKVSATQCTCLSLLHRHPAEFTFGERFAAEGIRDHQSVVAIVEPAWAKILRRREDGNANSAIAEDS